MYSFGVICTGYLGLHLYGVLLKLLLNIYCSLQELRYFADYFPYSTVRDNFFQLCTKLFGISFQVWSATKVKNVKYIVKDSYPDSEKILYAFELFLYEVILNGGKNHRFNSRFFYIKILNPLF